jgi:hypothetical protein
VPKTNIFPDVFFLQKLVFTIEIDCNLWACAGGQPKIFAFFAARVSTHWREKKCHHFWGTESFRHQTCQEKLNGPPLFRKSKNWNSERHSVWFSGWLHIYYCCLGRPLLPTVVGGLSQKMDGSCNVMHARFTGWTVGFIQNGCAAKSGPVKKKQYRRRFLGLLFWKCPSCHQKAMNARNRSKKTSHFYYYSSSYSCYC